MSGLQQPQKHGFQAVGASPDAALAGINMCDKGKLLYLARDRAERVRCSGLLLMGVLLVASAAAANGPWPPEFGDHRVVVHVDHDAPAVRVKLNWRLPRVRGLAVVDPVTGARVQNAVVREIDPTRLDVVFEPATGPGDYHLYFLAPYPTPSEPDAHWLENNKLSMDNVKSGRLNQLPEARTVCQEAASDFDAFTVMERAASAAEVQQMISRYADKPYLLVPEDRKQPIRMRDRLPLHWTEIDPRLPFCGRASAGEFYVFQIGVFAFNQAIMDLDVDFEDLKPLSHSGAVIPATAMRCINKSGVDWRGRSFEKAIAVPKGQVQALWCGVQIPVGAVPGEYRGAVTIRPDGALPSRVELHIEIDNQILENGGENDLWRNARLKWLDSTIALDDQPTDPFIPVKVEGSTARCLGRALTLNDDGLPVDIQSFFSADNMQITETARSLLAGPVQLILENVDGQVIALSGGKLQFVRQTPAAVTWRSHSGGGDLTVRCEATFQFDGCVEYCLTVTAERATPVGDIRLEIPLRREVANYLMGMGRAGGFLPTEHHWKWDAAKLQDSVWIGDVNAGLRCQLTGENYERPAIHEAKRPEMNLPPAWHNEGHGGCDIVQPEPGQVLIRAFSGARTIQPGQVLHFNFSLLLTPFKTLDTAEHWRDRYWHTPPPTYPSPEDAAAAGVNVVNIHQGTDLNPYINYPFLTSDQLKQLIDEAHARDVRVKLYYTTRELSNHVAEIWALRSLGDEVFETGAEGGGYNWLRDHLATGYVPAWQATVPGGGMDASLATRSLSRWQNYYLEGLRWLADQLEIDGLYLDGISYDRVVFQRVRKILDRHRPGSRIDWHSGNTFQPQYGMASVAEVYMEFFPYVDRIWFGEMFDYGAPADFWLIELSGIPFGVMGEMINGARYQGLVFGMTSRKGWAWGANDPQVVWQVWDDFGIADSQMIGFWVPDCPVRTSDARVKATVYRREDRALIALSSWSKQALRCRLTIDWRSLGLDSENMRLRAPAVEGIQPEQIFEPDDEIPMGPLQGWLLVAERAP